jgi:F-type H+-transporting ATPase subunit a
MLTTFAAAPTVHIGPEILFHLGPLTVTNSLLLGVIGTLIVIALFMTTVRQMRANKMGRLAHFMYWMFETMYDTATEVIGDRKVARNVMPYAVTLVFFFAINNWLGILPGIGSITYHDEPLFRGVAADMNTTFALAIMSMGLAQAWAIKRRGFFGNAKRYLQNPFKDPLHAFEGMLEIVAEFSRTLALSLRMFGNVFGGEVLLIVIAYLLGVASPLALPVFYVLELFVGAVQAYVFFMLTVAFISLGIPSQDDEHGDSDHAPDDTYDDVKAASDSTGGDGGAHHKEAKA